MSESEGRHGVLAGIVVTVLALAYFFVCAEPLSSELSTEPRWKSYVASDTPRVPTRVIQPAFGVQVRDRYGYFGEDGTVFFVSDSATPIAVSDEAFVSTMPSGSATIRAPDGSEFGTAPAMKPFFSNGRLFSAEADGTGLSRYSLDGAKDWTYYFPVQLSAFDSCASLTVGGTIDGWLEGIGPDGRKAFSFAPGGSRLPVILGVSVSDDGNWIAAMAGIDSQRLVVLGRGGADYRVTSHRYLESDYREPARLQVLADGRHVLYRRDDGIGIWSVDGSVDSILPVKAEDFSASIDETHGIVLLLAKHGASRSLAAFKSPATLIGSFRLPESTEFARFDGASVYLGGFDWVARLDFVEE